MAMTTCIPSIIPSSIAVVNFFALLFLLSSAHCFSHQEPVREGLVTAEKTRLGSTPPSCHNKCNQCDPCMAVQVPTLPNHDGSQPRAAAGGKQLQLEYFDSSAGNRYSNYKPLGWKCRCGSHFFNP